MKFRKPLAEKHRKKIFPLIDQVKRHNEHPHNAEIFRMRLEGNQIAGIRATMSPADSKKFTPQRIRRIEFKYLSKLDWLGEHPEAVKAAREYLGRPRIGSQ